MINRPTLVQLREQANAEMDTRITGASSRLRGSILNVLGIVHAGGLHSLWGYLQFLEQNALPDRANENGLSRWADLLEVPRRAATPTTIQVEITGEVGAVVEADTLFQRADGLTYVVAETVEMETDSATLTMVSEATGAVANVSPGTTLEAVSPISGVDSAGVVLTTLQTALDLQSVESWRSDILAVLRAPRSSGRAADYVRWAKEVSGVTRAWCLPHHMGVGTVGVTFMRDADDDPVPNQAQLEEVKTYIDARRLLGVVDVVVFAPVSKRVAPRILLSPNRAAVRANVQAALERLFLAAAVPGGSILISHIREAISTAAGENDHRLLSPTDDISSLTGELLTLGEITWA